MPASTVASTSIAGRFVLESLAGAGGMGMVYRARDEQTGQTVALKLIRATGKPQEVERFVREANLLATLRHPGIVGYLAHGVAETGEPYLAMEWLEGEDLSQRLARGALSLPESLTLLRRTAEALAVAHARGVVHRDLKPSNLFLRDGQVEHVALLDFGIARLLALSVMTRTGMMIGTPAYMAPEQARGERDVTPAVDVFSLGCVLFECLTGEGPFAADHVMAVLARICFDEPPKLRRVRPEMPEAVEALVGKMLAKSPADRLPDAAAVLAALDALDEVRPSAAPAAPRVAAEQQLLSVLMAIPPAGTYATPGSPESTIADATRVELHRELADLGARVEMLADGSLVATLWHTRGAATDQAARAAQCALLIKARWLDALIALCTGRGLTAERAPVGEVFDRAAALLREHVGAPPSEQILLDDVTRGLLSVRYVVQKTPSGVYTLTGEELELDASRPLLGKPTPCVGRDVELGMLESALAGCIEDREPRAVLVTAPPGAGKSRLMHELLRRVRVRAEGVLILGGRGDPLSAGSSYGLLGQAVRRLCEILEGESLEVRRQKLALRISERIPTPERARVVGFLGELSGVPFPDADNVKLRAARQNPQIMSDQITQAMLDLLRAECTERPVLLVLEDLHWGDALTVKLCETALRKLNDCPLMVLALARPEVNELFPRLWTGAAQVLPLRPLGKKAGERLVHLVLGKQVPKEMVARIVEQSEGNALFLEELIRAAAEGRGDEAPETVLAMLQARIGRLPAGARQVLRAASVFGETAWLGGIRALLGGSQGGPDLEDWFLRLTEEEILEERRDSRFPEEREVRFHHALMRDAAFSLLTPDDRALGHRLAGAWLEQHGEGDPLVLAEHFDRGKEPLRAGRYYLRAAELSFLGGDPTAAIARAERALEGGVPEDLRLPLLGLLCGAKAFRYDLIATVVPYAEEVMRVATPGNVPWVRAAMAKLHWALHEGKPEELMETLKGVEPSPDALGEVVLALAIGVFLLDTQGQIEAAELFLQRMHALVEPVQDREPLAAGWLNTLRADREARAREDPWMGLKTAGCSHVQFEEGGHRIGAALAQALSGMNLWMLGAHGNAEPALRSIPVPDDEFGPQSSIRLFSLSNVLVDRGALSEARSYALRLIESGSARRLPLDEGRGHWALAGVLLRTGELEAAEREARAALACLTVAPLDQPGILATLAAVELAQGRAGEALASAEDAMHRYQTMRACGFFRGAFVRLVHAEALHATSEPAQARAAISVARERLLANADKIGDPAYRRSFLENVPENARTLALAKEWLGLAEPL